jgi:SAM-dependent methyltransferase
VSARPWLADRVNDYRSVNRASWDERAPAHAASPGYALDKFRADPSFLSYVVQYDVARLGDIRGLRGVHLQCHIGTDTISLARLGAQMTGYDFSPAALAEARLLNDELGAGVAFVEGDLYDAVAVLGEEQFDLVFTGIGALCWLPDIKRWATVVARLLRSNGRLFIREGHPMLWSLADVGDDAVLRVEHPYFETAEPIVWEEGGTYVETSVEFVHNVTHEWNHGIGELVTAVLDNGMEITMLEEHDSVPWEALPGHMSTVPGTSHEWRLTDRPERLAHSYTLQAVKR